MAVKNQCDHMVGTQTHVHDSNGAILISAQDPFCKLTVLPLHQTGHIVLQVVDAALRIDQYLYAHARMTIIMHVHDVTNCFFCVPAHAVTVTLILIFKSPYTCIVHLCRLQVFYFSLQSRMPCVPMQLPLLPLGMYQVPPLLPQLQTCLHVYMYNNYVMYYTALVLHT